MGPLSAGELRRELSAHNLLLAEDVPHESTYGTVPSVLYYEIDGAHGNFLLASYRRICASAEWSRRLKKCYAASRRLPRPGDRIRRELDCANSSDALLMNIFCYPGVTRRKPQNLLDGREPPLALSSARDNPVYRVFVGSNLPDAGFWPISGLLNPHLRSAIILPELLSS